MTACRRTCSSAAIFIDVFAQWHARHGVRAVLGCSARYSSKLYRRQLSRASLITPRGSPLDREALMRRREAMGVIGGAAAWPLVTRAQPSRVNRIGALVIGLADVPSFQKEFQEGLREL